MNFKRTLAITVTACTITALGAFAVLKFGLQKVEAFNPQPDPPGFGIFGISESQIMKINVVNTAPVPSADTSSDPCRVVMTVLDQNGNALTRSDGAVIRRIAQLAGGQSISIAVDASNFIRSGRLQLRPVAQIQQADGDGLHPPDPCIPSVEVISSANGNTQFAIQTVPNIERTVQAN
jgi:hypothetical protein